MYIAVEGNIGAGKSTFSKALSQQLNAELLLEEFEDHPQLKDFYDGKQVDHFELERWFLIKRFEQLRQAQKSVQPIVSDYWFEKSMIFANINLKELEKINFAKEFYRFQSLLKHPDAIVFIDSSSDELKKSIDNRDREIEKNISVDYLLKISTAYKKRMAGLKGVKIFSFNMHDIRLKPINDSVKIVLDTLKLNA